MAKTELDVITKALQVLNVVELGGTADAAIYATSQDVYQVFHNELQAELRDAYKLSRRSWNYNSVPDEIWINVAVMLAEKLAGILRVDSEIALRSSLQASQANTALTKMLARRKGSFDRYPEFPANRANWSGATING